LRWRKRRRAGAEHRYSATIVDIRNYLSDEGQAVVALCSAFALEENGVVSPFTLSQWNDLERQLKKSSVRSAANLQGRSADEIRKEMEVPSHEAERIVRLLERSARLALELENLFSKGMWAVTRVDESYPAKLAKNLKHHAPSVLFGSGNLGLFSKSSVAVVGSRNIDEAGADFAKLVGRKAVAGDMAVVSGGARGTDRIAMDGALDAAGVAIGVLADSLEMTIRKPDVRDYVLDARLTLVTPYVPTAGFSIGGAMGRNKIIYGLADYAVVVSSEIKTGGTWAGAVEAFKGEWCPVFVRDEHVMPQGNKELIKLGGIGLSPEKLEASEHLARLLAQTRKSTMKPVEQDLFG
jgi:predicted Rossmann fold nucleotide-binding protein DprA/Smf involved in DNA uptake